MYNAFDVISLKKIHYNIFFTYIRKPKRFSDKLLSSNEQSWIFKTRPALVLRRISKKHNGEGKDKYLLIPFTTKDSLRGWENGMELFRLRFNHPSLKNGFSYLMLDSMMLVSEKDIDGIYTPGSEEVKISTAQSRWLIKQINIKFKNMFNIFNEA